LCVQYITGYSFSETISNDFIHVSDMFRVRDRILWVLGERELPPEDNPMGVSYHENFFRKRSIPLLTTRTLTAADRETAGFAGYIRAAHGNYYEALPPYPRYLFRKFAFYRTGSYMPRLTDDIPDHPNEWPDSVCLSQGLLNYFGGNVSFVAMIEDQKYVDENRHQLNEMFLSAYTFLMEVVPRIANKNALVMYEEYMPDWCRIIEGYLNRVCGDDLPPIPEQLINYVIPVESAVTTEESATERIDEEAIEAVEETVQEEDDNGGNAANANNAKSTIDAGTSSSIIADDLLCKLCCSAQRSTMYIPCRHCVSCQDCTTAWLARKKKCPLCNMPSNSYVNFYFS
jgi:hypothetical protein